MIRETADTKVEGLRRDFLLSSHSNTAVVVVVAVVVGKVQIAFAATGTLSVGAEVAGPQSQTRSILGPVASSQSAEAAKVVGCIAAGIVAG